MIKTGDKVYLSLKELCARLPYARKTYYNWISSGIWHEGDHFFRRRRKLIFCWPAIEAWLREGRNGSAQ
jgi:hypothetical protein